MVGGKRRHRRQREFLGSHQKAWLFGRHVVLETLRAARWEPLELWIAEDIDPQCGDEARALAARLEIEPVISTGAVMSRRCGSLAHQGLMARMPPFPYTSLADLLAAVSGPPFLVILDSIQDPFNFGAIVRSADVFGAGGVIVGITEQSAVTAQVARSSAGAVNHVPIAQLPDLVDAARRLKEHGLRIIAASEKAQHPVSAIDLTQACAIVVGNEGAGIQDALLAVCDETAAIPQAGRVGSLNAAVAAGVLLYEVQRQRHSSTNSART
jgi:23S rRNA (guanosine2251-2'-O)-methyltransferase